MRSLYAQMSRSERKFSTCSKSRKPEKAEHRLNVNPPPEDTFGQEARPKTHVPAHHYADCCCSQAKSEINGTERASKRFCWTYLVCESAGQCTADCRENLLRSATHSSRELVTLNRGLQIYVGRSLPFASRTRSNPDSKPLVFLKEEPQARRNAEASRA